jgi:hypothetical protein
VSRGISFAETVELRSCLDARSYLPSIYSKARSAHTRYAVRTQRNMQCARGTVRRGRAHAVPYVGSASGECVRPCARPVGVRRGHGRRGAREPWQ